jgi:hypothetical protein
MIRTCNVCLICHVLLLLVVCVLLLKVRPTIYNTTIFINSLLFFFLHLCAHFTCSQNNYILFKLVLYICFSGCMKRNLQSYNNNDENRNEKMPHKNDKKDSFFLSLVVVSLLSIFRK